MSLMRSTLLLCLALAVACSEPSGDFNVRVTPVSVDIFPGQERTVRVVGEWAGEAPPKPILVEPRNWPPELGTFEPFELTPDAPEKDVTFQFPNTTQPGERVAPFVARSNGAVKWQVFEFLVRAPPGALDTSFGSNGTLRLCDKGNESLLTLSLDVPGLIRLFGSSPGAVTAAQVEDTGKGDPVFFERELPGFEQVDLSVFLYDPDRFLMWTAASTPLSTFIANASLDTSAGAPAPTVLEHREFLSIGAAALPTSTVLFAGGSRMPSNELAVLRLDRVGGPSNFSGTGNNLARMSLTGMVRARAIWPAPRGRMLVGGGDGAGAFVARFAATGLPDTTFGTAGVFHFAGPGGYVTAVNETPSGQVIAAGVTQGKSFAARLTSTGALDTSFGQGGVVLLADATAGKVLLAEGEEGVLYVAMSVRTGAADVDFAVVALNTDGSVKKGFGEAGWRITPVAAGDDLLVGFQAISNRTLLLAGTTVDSKSRCYGLARVWQ